MYVFKALPLSLRCVKKHASNSYVRPCFDIVLRTFSLYSFCFARRARSASVIDLNESMRVRSFGCLFSLWFSAKEGQLCTEDTKLLQRGFSLPPSSVPTEATSSNSRFAVHGLRCGSEVHFSSPKTLLKKCCFTSKKCASSRF